MIHQELSPERWYTFSTLEQMAHIGCDIDRAIRWRNKGDINHSQRALYRGLELLDLTISDSKNKGGRRRELARLREFLKDYFLCGNHYKILDDVFLHNYFFSFSYAAAWERGR